jgi:hypothetical protein
MIVCHVCGTENADSNKYCEGCGVELQAAAPASAAVAAPVVSEVAPTPEAAPAPEAAPVVETVPATVSDVVPTVGTTVQGDKTIE